MSVKRCFGRHDIAETPPVFYKDSANEWKESLLLLSRVPPVFYKDSANEWKESLLLLSRVPPVFYKDTYNILLHPKPDTSF